VSIVRLICECPNVSITILGWTPCTNSSEAQDRWAALDPIHRGCSRPSVRLQTTSRVASRCGGIGGPQYVADAFRNELAWHSQRCPQRPRPLHHFAVSAKGPQPVGQDQTKRVGGA